MDQLEIELKISRVYPGALSLSYTSWCSIAERPADPSCLHCHLLKCASFEHLADS